MAWAGYISRVPGEGGDLLKGESILYGQGIRRGRQICAGPRGTYRSVSSDRSAGSGIPALNASMAADRGLKRVEFVREGEGGLVDWSCARALAQEN